MTIELLPIKTRPIQPPKDDIYPILEQYLPPLKEGDVLLITSKVLAIHQGRCVKIDPSKTQAEQQQTKDALIKKEAERYIPREQVPNNAVILTIKENTLIPSAGIDESNANGHYVLWPLESSRLAKEICRHLQKLHSVKNLAVIVTDSHTTPLRWGVQGISIGFFGLEPLYDYRGKKDIFGRTLQMTQKNVVDSLAVMGVSAMGEADECTPFVIIRGAPEVAFTDQETYDKLIIPGEMDIYKPLMERFG